MGLILELQPSLGRALVVGGGVIALRKARTLSEGGFACLVVAPELDPEFASLPGAQCVARAFEPGDIARERWSAVFACTDSREVNREVGVLARAAGIPVSVADRQAESTFFTPATLRDGPLTVSISTGGAAPAVAKALRVTLQEALGEGWADRIAKAAAARRRP